MVSTSFPPLGTTGTARFDPPGTPIPVHGRISSNARRRRETGGDAEACGFVELGCGAVCALEHRFVGAVRSPSENFMTPKV